ncbi:MAG: DUF3244 domain-containing protein [Bacteroides sp.]|nr:DUF3244 domain-containing protein [Bacteroides sp.]
MKKTISTFMFLLCAIMSIQAALPSTPAIEEKKPIDIESEDQNEREKSLIILFEAWQTDNKEIEIVSYHACTNVTINICTINGQVLDSQTLSFTSMQSFTFNIGNYAESYYLVKISTPSNTEYSGTFVID